MQIHALLSSTSIPSRFRFLPSVSSIPKNKILFLDLSLITAKSPTPNLQPGQDALICTQCVLLTLICFPYQNFSYQEFFDLGIFFFVNFMKTFSTGGFVWSLDDENGTEKNIPSYEYSVAPSITNHYILSILLYLL